VDNNLAADAAALEGGEGAGAAAPAGAVADGGAGAACAALSGSADAVAASARTTAEREAMYKEIDALYEAHEYVEPCEVNLCLCSHIRFVSRQG
jgi:hypothetical protein